MIEQTFSIYHLEYYLAIFVRVMGAIAFAPIFGNRTVTRRVRIFIGIACALAVFTANPYVPLGYSTFLEYTILLLKELIVGITIGFMSNVTLSIINAAGQFIDREIGFSMVSDFDPGMNTEITITAEFYNMLVMLIMLLNVVLGVLAKTAPQMNMFVIGMQLKIFVGFAVLFVTIGFLPNITEYIYKEMQTVVTDVIKAFM